MTGIVQLFDHHITETYNDLLSQNIVKIYSNDPVSYSYVAVTLLYFVKEKIIVQQYQNLVKVLYVCTVIRQWSINSMEC